MTTQFNDSFPVGIAEKIGHYVYRLYDPRSGETFYVGKGTGDRVFSHVNQNIGSETHNETVKMQRIHEIHLAGFQVGHVIHRHGMDEKTALHVEGALIDAYPGLMNIADGHGSNDYGAMHTQQLIQSYLATTANFEKHKVMMISVNRTATSMNLYEAVRYAWKIDIRKARQADVVLATQVGIIKGVFIAEEWLEATSQNFPGRNTMHGRFGFRGKEADVDIKTLYLGKGVPDVFRKKGASNPIKYTWNRFQNVAPK